MPDPATELCQRLQGETLERIRAHRRGASVQVARLLALIEERLLDPDLTVSALRRWCGERDKNVSTRFHAELGLTPWAYILQARMELAGRMLAASELKIWQIGLQVGYDSGHSFGRAFKRWSKETPKQFRRRSWAEQAEERRAASAPEAETAADVVDNARLRAALAGDLPLDEAGALVDRLESVLGEIRGVYKPLQPEVPGRHAVEPVMARRLWEWIEALPHEAQVAAIESQAPAFHTPALFHVLCTESIHAGADDEMRGVQIVSLALICLPSIAERLGDRSMHIFARAYLIAGLAFYRAGERREGEGYVGVAFRMIQQMGDDAHPLVVAELCLYQSMFELERGDVGMAKGLASQGFELLKALANRLGVERRKARSGSGKKGGKARPPGR